MIGILEWNKLMLLQCLLYCSSQLHGLFGTVPSSLFWIFIWVLLVKFSCDGSHKISIWYTKLYRDRWMKFLCSPHQHCWHPRLFLIKLVSLDKLVIGMIRGLLLHDFFQSILIEFYKQLYLIKPYVVIFTDSPVSWVC